MDKLLEKLHEIKKSLKPGTVAGGRNMPTIKTPMDNGPKINAKDGAQKLKGIAQGSKVNPVKSAEQTQNKDIKDMKMKEAQQALKVKPLAMTKGDDDFSFPYGVNSHEEKLAHINKVAGKLKSNLQRAVKSGNQKEIKYHENLLNTHKQKEEKYRQAMGKSEQVTLSKNGQWSIN